MSGRGQAVTSAAPPTPPTTITITLPGFIGPTGTDITDNWFRVPLGGMDLTGATVSIVMRTAAGTTNPSWDLMVSTNDGTSFTTVLPSGVTNKLIATAGNHVTDITPAWATTVLNDGDLLRVDLVQTDDGSGQDVTIYIQLVP